MTKHNRLISAAAVIALIGTAGALHAATAQSGFAKASKPMQAKPMQAMAIDLGTVSGVAYYTAEDRGYRVVVTLESSTDQNPVRFESVLAADQSVTVSTPRGVNAESRTIALTHRGNGIVVTADHTAEGY